MRAIAHKLWDLTIGCWQSHSCRKAIAAQLPERRALIPTNLKDRLAKLDVTQAQFVSFCGVHPNTVNNWANGRTLMHPSAERVLTVLEHNAALRRYTREKAAPRGKPFAAGNPYRFGDKRRAVYVAGAQYARAAA
jgi:DNA-binding transcriptional regulator YiaG